MVITVIATRFGDEGPGAPIKSTTANIEARNASKVEVGTTQSLWMSAHDASKITYKGTPVILQSIQEGMSKIKQDN